MSQPTEDRKGRTPLWVKLTLAGSLALNLLIGGVVLGAFLGKENRPIDRVRAAREIAPAPFVLALEPETRKGMIDAFRKSDHKRPDRRAMRRRFEALLAALRADAFDPTTVADLLTDVRQSSAERQQNGAELFIQTLSTLSLAERRAYADRLERAIRRGRRP